MQVYTTRVRNPHEQAITALNEVLVAPVTYPPPSCASVAREPFLDPISGNGLAKPRRNSVDIHCVQEPLG